MKFATDTAVEPSPLVARRRDVNEVGEVGRRFLGSLLSGEVGAMRDLSLNYPLVLLPVLARETGEIRECC